MTPSREFIPPVASKKLMSGQAFVCRIAWLNDRCAWSGLQVISKKAHLLVMMPFMPELKES